MSPSPRATAVHENDALSLPVELAKGWFKVPIDGSVGARHLEQRVLRIGSEESVVLKFDHSEATLYCADGNGWASLDGEEAEVRPGTAILIPPGSTFTLAKEGRPDVAFVIVLAPPPGVAAKAERGSSRIRIRDLTIHEDDRPDEPAGPDRHFKVLVDPALGCQTMTQFVGFIEQGAAPPHHHDHEEAIYVVEGDGILHSGGQNIAIRPGTSIFLPPGTPHALENTHRDALKVLGVFSPPGSPAAMTDDSR